MEPTWSIGQPKKKEALKEIYVKHLEKTVRYKNGPHLTQSV